MIEINLHQTENKKLASKIINMLEVRGYKPDESEDFILHGSKHSSFLVTGSAINNNLSEPCKEGNSSDVDCNYIPCNAHARKVPVAITEKQVYMIWNAESEMEIRNILIEENLIPVTKI